MADLCDDNRFKIIEAVKKNLIEATNIETSPEEMAVLDNILFRIWQMGWLPVHAHWIEQYDAGGKFYMCSNCAQSNGRPYYKYCPDCGAKMDEEVL